MYVIVSELDKNQWLCYDGLADDYFYKSSFDWRAIKAKDVSQLDLTKIPSSFAVKVMKLELVDI